MEQQNKQNVSGSGLELNPMDLLHVALKKWYYYVGAVVCCLLIAYIYLHRTAPMYQRMATVLIKDKESGTRTPSEAEIFKEVGFMNLSGNVENEILIFKSLHLAEQVVRRLDLDVCYQVKGFWRPTDLYGVSPVTVHFVQGDDLACSFRLRLLPGRKVELSQLKYQAQELTETKTFALNDTVQTAVGQLVVVSTGFYQKFDRELEIEVLKSTVRNTGNALVARLGVAKASKESSMIQLNITDPVPQRAEDILNTLVDAYKEDIVNDKNTVARNTERFVVDRLAILEKELGNVDNQIASYRSANQLIDGTQSGLYLQRADQFQNEAVQLQTELELTRYLKEFLLQPKNDKSLIPVNIGVSETNLVNQIAEYNKMRLQCDKMESTTAVENPVVQDLQQAMLSLRESILRTMDNHIEALQLRLRSTVQQEVRSSGKAANIPNHQKVVLSAERQQKVKEQLYVYLLQKREENALAEYIAESNARVVDRAKGSNLPVSPKTQMVYLSALILGLALPTVVIFLMLIMDTKVRNRKDVENKLTMPFLGDIPYHSWEKGKAHDTVVRADGLDAVTEAFRILRTNLDFMKGEQQGPLKIMFTSMNPDAGKTFVISNLAKMFAFAGKRVLLVDLDIRKGSLSRIFGGRKATGITQYLIDRQMAAKELICPVKDCPGLDVIYSGVVPPNPAELLMSARLDQLLEELAASYDYILIDSVPSAVVADASIVNRLADLTVFVIRAGLMDRRQLPDVERIYQEKKLKRMVTLLNGVKKEHAGYGYYGYYGGYGYGYGDQKKKKKNFGLF